MKLFVIHKKKLVGTLESAAPDNIHFEYAPEWIENPHCFPISISLPLSGDYTRGIEDHRFFANLLPESTARESICQGLGISIGNDFELLKAIGGECAGALQILPDFPQDQTENGYEPIRDETLKKAIQTQRSYPRLHIDGRLRLSLAGAQDKWPVYYHDNSLYWPVGNSPSSHILKFAPKDFKELNHNESYICYLASRLQLPVERISVHTGYSLAERYDRIRTDEGKIERIHQEDLCQALGYASFSKYESEGGPSLKECVSTLQNVSITPAVDAMNLIRWQILNLLLGNSDGHSKNLSLLYTDEGIRLAPFYDLVCTRVYNGIDPNLAFSIGGEKDPGHIGKRNWERMAEELEVSPRLIIRILGGFLEDLENNLDRYYAAYSVAKETSPVLNRINLLIKKQIRRTRTLLR